MRSVMVSHWWTAEVHQVHHASLSPAPLEKDGDRKYENGPLTFSFSCFFYDWYFRPPSKCICMIHQSFLHCVISWQHHHFPQSHLNCEDWAIRFRKLVEWIERGGTWCLAKQKILVIQQVQRSSSHMALALHLLSKMLGIHAASVGASVI